MKAKLIEGQAPGGERMSLAKSLPLDTPLVVQFFPIYACNFVCKYCVFSTDKANRGFVSDCVVMDIKLYRKCIDDMKLFSDKFKVLRFVGMGEPLLHKDIVEMVKYAADSHVAERIEILTNGSLLTNSLSLDLISAGLNRLLVSIQGTSSDKYRDVCKIDIDFEEFVENIRFFYANRGGAQLHIKIIDCALDNVEDEQKFFEIFGDICDSIGVENVGPIYPWVDYNNVCGDDQQQVTQYGLSTSEIGVCPQPFFTLQINPDGKVVPCYSIDYPCIVGDTNLESVCDIWRSVALKSFRCKMLEGIKSASLACSNCMIIKHRVFPEDRLDNDVERLKKAYGCSVYDKT